MRRDKTLLEYTNRYFENRNTLVGVINYYKKGLPTSSSSTRSTKLTLTPLPTSWLTSTS
jgi:hypothetical protein